jgi:hypothetical protein
MRITPTKVTAYKTSDGTVFATELEAQRHEFVEYFRNRLGFREEFVEAAWDYRQELYDFLSDLNLIRSAEAKETN